MKSPDNDRFVGDLPFLQSADEAQAIVPERATLLVSGFGSVGYPKAVPKALKRSPRDLSLTVVSGGSVGKEIDTDLVEADKIRRRYPYQARPESREKINDDSIAFHDRNISQVGDEVRYGQLVDGGIAVVEAVAVGEDWFIPTTSIGQTPAFVDVAEKLIVEVNRSQPVALKELHDVFRQGDPPGRKPIPLDSAGDRIGSAKVQFDPEKLEAVIETDSPDTSYEFRQPTAADEAIGDHMAKFLQEEIERRSVFDDRVHIQFGVGSLGNALMSKLSEVDFNGRDLFYFGEVIQDGLLDMISNGELSAASATSLALSRRGQEKLFGNVDQFTDEIVVRPADVSNSPALIDRFGVIAVNSALEVDIYGHANSTHINGTTLVNGIGGSADFMRHGFISVIALPSATNRGTSRIVPMVPHVDHTEHDIDVVITEQGVADLRGLSPSERADLIVQECSHPDVKPDLEEYLKKARIESGHIAHHFSSLSNWY